MRRRLVVAAHRHSSAGKRRRLAPVGDAIRVRALRRCSCDMTNVASRPNLSASFEGSQTSSSTFRRVRARRWRSGRTPALRPVSNNSRSPRCRKLLITEESVASDATHCRATHDTSRAATHLADRCSADRRAFSQPATDTLSGQIEDPERRRLWPAARDVRRLCWRRGSAGGR